MFSKIILNKSNLYSNIDFLKSSAKGKLCAMVKANAYGHGAKEIVKLLEGRVEYFGVSSQAEAEQLRQFTNSKIIVFGACEDYQTCINKDIAFALLSYKDAKEIARISKKTKKKPHMHLCINSGMNRYGIKTIQDFLKVQGLFKKNNLKLEGIYTHLSSLTTDKEYSQKQFSKFQEFANLIPDKDVVTHIGGGNSIFSQFSADMYRVGLEIYGYGNSNVKPVLKIESQIVDIQEVEKGEHVGYLCSYTASKNMKVATIPLGYGDGLPRKLSNQFQVKIKGKNAENVGNICMDAFMVDVTNIKCKIGDKVLILDDASVLSQKIESTEYEVLTNLSKFRGERIIN